MKKAVLLMSMGGPGRAEDIKPFLFNLFKDKAILRYPCFVRYILAFIISTLRTPLARGNYAKIGGGSPLLKNTQAQAMALEDALNIDAGDVEYKCFVGMRYWHPFIGEAVKQIKKYGPHEIILLPLYPQFSTTTTVSALDLSLIHI